MALRALCAQSVARAFSSFSNVAAGAGGGQRTHINNYCYRARECRQSALVAVSASVRRASTAADDDHSSTASRTVGPSRQLRIYNSLSRTKEAVLVNHPLTQPLSWYQCGPTVYDSAHLGHARTYVSFDILHRIMSDYCNLPVSMAMVRQP